ncbi:MAG: polyribonucleotide nucleotidyltransferase [Spirochaetales bacterium]|nr:polyribonucleotide nucleotidyltransferase [Spirochaetales bacterium]
MIQRVKLNIRDQEVILETGRMAKQANGAVLVRCADTMVLATACCSDKEIEGLDYLPLQVEYNERYYAAGKIPGGFLKREGRPRDKEILVSRLIDRPMRPLFDKKLRRDIQIVPTVISADQINPPDTLAMVAASAAVTISDIPFDGPVGAVRVAYLDGAFLVNPTFEEIEKSELDIVVSGTADGITMVEGGGNEVSEELMLGAIEEAHKVIKELCAIQLELKKLAGKEKFELKAKEEEPMAVLEEIKAFAEPKLKEACFVIGKHIRMNAIKVIEQEVFEKYAEQIPEGREKAVKELLHDLEVVIVRTSILENKKRTDNRNPEDIRPITCEIDVLPRTHGSALFTRGETQALATSTLGTIFDEQIMDDIEGDTRKKFMLHYNFPPFSVGETGRLGAGRREIGHGHLAERALKAVLPEKTEFPYTLRIVSEVLESNGSSSMATVCAGTLSMLNAGIPLKGPVAGIAMGLISDGGRYVVLSDILGEEDHLGDMDFKVAGTEKGITAFQMDIKIAGVDAEIMTKALSQAKEGRMHILGIMNDTIKEPAEEISEHAPKIMTLKVEQDKIGAVIGPGGKVIKSITEKTGADVNIDNDGTVTIFCKKRDGALAAQDMIKGIVAEPEIGAIYVGTVKRIMDFGAFIEFMPGKEGLCHVSKLSRQRIDSPHDVLEEGQEIRVKLVEIDRFGRINLSHVDAVDPVDDDGEEKQTDGEQRNNSFRDRDRPPRDRGHDRSGRGRGDRDRGRDRGRDQNRPPRRHD